MIISRRRFAQLLGVVALAPALPAVAAPVEAHSIWEPFITPPLSAHCYSGTTLVGVCEAHGHIVSPRQAEILFDATFTAHISKVVIVRDSFVVMSLRESIPMTRGSTAKLTLFAEA